MDRVKDKVIIITGGAGGIGKETAKLLAKEGAKVVIFDINEDRLTEAKKEIEKYGIVKAIKADVTDFKSVSDAVNKVYEKFGKIDVLINNAGITRDGFLSKMDLEDWNKVIAVNLTGVFNTTKAVVPYMLERGKGNIISISSVVGVYGNIGQTNYAASKAGIIGMTKTWAKELGRKGIRANAVAPGFIKTEMTAKVPEKVINIMIEKTPLGRMGEPEDVANLLLFLSSDESSFINGQVIGVDGGLIP
ncbi:MAG: 3-oxoacyl-ACP reductase FabG [Caldisericia bacterium]|nr:3-oxoacyl-ACP reductase FabG [Caldisericia bacterium]